MNHTLPADIQFMRLALRLAKRGFGSASPNPMVGSVLVKKGRVIGSGWHRRAGLPHAEIEALRDARSKGNDPAGATLFTTLEPCCTHGRTPPCTEAIIAAGIARVVVSVVDSNPLHEGRAFAILEQAGIQVSCGMLADQSNHLNEAFCHWTAHKTPFVTVKAAMTLDGKIATASGESKWITSETARAYAMKLRQGADAIAVGINTVLADDPSLTVRLAPSPNTNARSAEHEKCAQKPRRIILDCKARTPLNAKVVSDGHADLTTVVVSNLAPTKRVAALAKRVNIVVSPASRNRIDLEWLLGKLGAEDVLSLLVEGGGEVNASFLNARLAQRIVFFYAPKIIGHLGAHKAVAGQQLNPLAKPGLLQDVKWRRLGADLMLTAIVA